MLLAIANASAKSGNLAQLRTTGKRESKLPVYKGKGARTDCRNYMGYRAEKDV